MRVEKLSLRVDAAADLAAWDLVARRAGQPLWRLLGGRTDRVPVYASGLNPDAPERLAVERRAAGHTRFKLKVGFGERRDLDNLQKAAFDALTKAGFWIDDVQVVDYRVVKMPIVKGGCLELTITELEDS